MTRFAKKSVSDMAFFGGQPVFDEIKSTSNLVRPSEDGFLNYCKTIFETRRISNNGDLVQQFEKRLCELHNVEHCIATSNGLWSLIMLLKAIKLKGKTEVIMPSLTYRRLADVAAWVKLTPHFCDVELKTMAISRETIEPCINDNTAAIVAVHSIVTPCDIDGISQLAKEKNIPLMFDSVEAVYATHKGKPIGGFGEAEVFSTHASKLINGFEGGYITTNNSELAEELGLMRKFGFIDVDTVGMLGINAKLNEIHAAMALAALDDLEAQVERNKKRYHKYKELLSDFSAVDLVEFAEEEGERRAFKVIVVRLNEAWGLSREDTLKIMHAEKMLVRPYYAPPLHMKKAGYKTITGDMTNTDQLKDNHMLMPCGAFVSEEDVEKAASFMKFVHGNLSEIKQRLDNDGKYEKRRA